jgi:hypothetical protein
VLGREFSYELIEPVAQRPERELQAALGRLSDAGLLFCRGTAPHASYLFKHALVQDAAYGTLLRGRRQELHGRVAAALETRFADLVERQPGLLAHHLTAAGGTERAAHQWLKAGRHAAAQSAYLDAIAHLERGLGLLLRCRRVSTGTDAKSTCDWHWRAVCSPPEAPSPRNGPICRRSISPRAAARRSNGLMRSTGYGSQPIWPVEVPPPARSPRDC